MVKLSEWDKPTNHGPIIIKNGLYVCALCKQNIGSKGCK